MWRWAMIGLMMVAAMPVAAREMPEETVSQAVHMRQQIKQEMGFQRVYGTVEAVDEKGAMIQGENEAWYLHLQETPVLDAQRGVRVHRKLEKGERIEVFIQHNRPVMLSYPAQVVPDLVVVQPNRNYSVDMDYFTQEGEGISRRLVIRRLPDKITDNFGRPVAANQVLEHRLIVLYTMATRSIPPQTNPDKVIVYQGHYPEDIRQVQDENGTVLYGLRELAEHFGAAVIWNESERTVTLGGPFQAKVTIDQAKLEMNGTVISPVIRPVIRDGHVYVGQDILKLLLQNQSWK